MKKTLLSVSLFALFFIAAGQKVEINNSGFFIKGTKITKGSTMADIETLLGKADKISPLANIIWTYDSLGIYIYFGSKDSVLKHISFDLVKHDLKFSPATAFKGFILVHKNVVNKASSLARLKKIKTLRFDGEPAYLNQAYTSYVKIFFEFDDAKTVLRNAGVALDFKQHD
jgi:hypothetical protein